ncbi:MAG: Gfo/Idh/MocA family oxidoreductase [Methylobacteriaceae bacterium]|nr:Gfo/Idh/MocA family oxidoreductase [Methylobacteriaceae bacterium]
MARSVSWGVLSTARIGVERVIPAMQRGEISRIDAIASRDATHAQAVADQLGIPKAYGSYEELLADPGIEAVYNPLPNHLHVPWTVKAMEAGKHVLCEKPIALNAEQAEQLIEARGRTGRHVVEAFMVRHNPQWRRARAIAMDGSIGEVRAIQCLFTYYLVDPSNVRNQAEIGGGGLFDIGCYAITTARFIFGAAPERVVGLIDRDPEFRTDRLTSGLAEFPRHRHLAFIVSTQLLPHQRVQICGTKGRIEIEVPFNAPHDRPCRIFIDREGDRFGSGVAAEEMPTCDQYTLQGDAFSRIVLGEEEPEYPIEDAVMNMRIIDAFFRSARNGSWESIQAA